MTAAAAPVEVMPPRPPLPVDEPTTAGPAEPPAIRSRRAATFAVRRARFTFGGRIQLGALNLLVGIGGLNKSTATARLAADASTGRLDGDLSDVPATTLLASAEDDTETVTVPRLVAAGADLDRIVIPDEPLVLPDDVDRLGRLVAAEAVDLLVVDPLVAFLDGATDSHNDASVRQALAALRPLTEDHELTTLAVLHLNKSRARDVYTRISGSAGFFNASRSVIAMTADPRDRDDDLARVLWHEKANAGPKARPQACAVVPVDVDATDGEAVPTIRLDLGEWLDGLDIGDALDPSDDREPSKAERAAGLLRSLLADGPRRRSDIEQAATGDGIGWRTVEAAKADLNVESRQIPEPGRRGAGPSWWRLLDVGDWPEGPQTLWDTDLADHPSIPGNGPQPPLTPTTDHPTPLQAPKPPHTPEEAKGPQTERTPDGTPTSTPERSATNHQHCTRCGRLTFTSPCRDCRPDTPS